MGNVLFVACTNVGKAMIHSLYARADIQSRVVGIVNLSPEQGLNKANYFTYTDISETYGIPLHFCNNVNDAETLQWIQDKRPDVIIQTGWSQKFHKELLSLPTYGCIGEHPAPLPKGRGAACVNWAILTGETKWGDSFFRMVDEYDRGEIYAQAFFDIREYDDVKTVYDKVAACSSRIICDNIDLWSSGRFQPIPIDEKDATYYKRRRPSDGLFSFDRPAKELHDFIRAQTDPYPGAFFTYRGERITVLRARNTKTHYDEPFGSVIDRTEEGGIRVVCGDGIALDLLRFRSESGCCYWFAEDVRFTPGANLAL